MPKLPLPPPLPPIWATCTTFFGRQKQRISEPSNDDYDNGVSDNCDHNFGTFDDFGVKNDQKVSHDMILMSKYKGQYGGKKGQKIRAGVSPPPFQAMPERKHFFHEGFPKAFEEEKILLDSYIVTLLYLYTFIFFIFYFSNLCIVKFILLIHTFEYM